MLKKLSFFVFSLLVLVTLASCQNNAGQTSKITVTFNSNGGTLIEEIELDQEATILQPADPEKEGYEFVGWYLDGELFDFDNYVVNESITLKAEWNKIVEAKTYIVKLYLNGGECDIEQIEFKDFKEVVLPIPTKEGFKFIGWFTGTTKVEELTENKHYVLTAKWEEAEVIVTYKITYVLNGGKLEEGYPEEYDNAEGVDLPIPTKEGYEFVGWYTTEDFSNNRVAKVPQGTGKDVTVYAKWIEKTVEPTTYTITLRANGGQVSITSIEFTNYNEVELPEPTKEAFDFIGWYEGSTLVESITENRNYTLVAKWQGHTKKISYELDGGSFEGKYPTEYVVGTSTNLVNPVKEGHKFIGWYKTSDFSGSIMTRIPGSSKVDVTLYAKWEKIVFSAISYELNDGILPTDAPTSYQEGVGIAKLPVPTREGYNFLGWYIGEQNVTSISTSQKGDVILTAQWEVKLPAVKYVLNGGNWSYRSREQIVEDFLADAMAWGGKTRKPDGMVQGEGTTQIGFANVFSSIYGIFSDSKYQAKWSWLKEYIIEATTVANSKTYLQNGSEPFWRYSLGAFLFEEYRSSYPISEDYTKDSAANGFWDTLSKYQDTEFECSGEPKTPLRLYYIFDGWYDNPEFTGNPITSIGQDVTLYAKWIEEIPVDSISITNKINAIDRFQTHQLTWALNPSNAAIKGVEFESSDTDIAIVDENGLITALNNGSVTITIRSLSPSKVTDTVTINVSSPDHFDVSYDDESYVAVDGQIKLNASYVKRDGSLCAVIWETMTPSIATVDANGVVTAVAEGEAIIRVSLESDSSKYFEFAITVLSKEVAKELQLVVDGHESNIFTRYNLGIGAGTPVYYADILGSVNDMIFDYEINYNTKYLAACMANGQWSSGLTKIEFITVHYTAGMTKGSNAEATARFFSSNSGASAHFCTGNDGVFQTLDLDVKGWHAGDGANTTFEWNPTGVKYVEGDPQWPTWGISQNAKFTINGKETSIKVPEKTQNGNEGFVTSDKWLNDQGFAFKIVNGEYYMGTTWWCYSNVWEGRICSRGGNKHSIGIESAVDYGSDLWYTWQITAKLVAQLLVEYNLDITRVQGHHFFAGKDCPQPLLENDLEIWWKFIEMVKAELEAMTTHKDISYKYEVLRGKDIINEHGRVVSQPEYSQTVTYKVTTSSGKTITLSSIVPGIYTK